MESDTKKAKRLYEATKREAEGYGKKVKEGQKALHRETAKFRKDVENKRNKEDSTYKTTDEDRKRYKKSMKRKKRVDFFKKYGIKIKQYK